MNDVRVLVRGIAHSAPIPGPLVPVTLALAIATQARLVSSDVGEYLAVLGVASATLLAIACLATTVVQFVQQDLNRTPLVPALVLMYAAIALSGAVTSAAWPVTFPSPAIQHAVLFRVFPGIAAIVGVQWIMELATGHPVHREAVGHGRVYTVSREALARFVKAPSRVQSEFGGATTKTPAGQSLQFRAERPRATFRDLYGNDELKHRLAEAGAAWSGNGKNGILLFGPPGGGKTAFAEALAGQLELGFLKVTLGDLASRWVNQTTEQLVAVFRDARSQAPVLLFLDEVDSILKERGSVNRAEEYERLVNVFLTAIVDARGTKVLVVAATNFMDKLDRAATREGRFDFKIEVPLPDAAARRGLIQSRVDAAGCVVDAETLDRLVRRWSGFNVPRLIACAGGACALASTAAEGTADVGVHPGVRYADFYRALRKLQGRHGGAPEGTKRLEDLFLDPEQAEKLRSLAKQLTCVDEVERLGGSLPKGVLFYGPPGTGKTAAAMALAAECGWSFITRTGRSLLAAGAVDELRKEAGDLRPAIVFIDEVDDILGERSISPYKAATNELLALIDGAGGSLHDVVWIAATNHPDDMDAAARRGGRFGQKIGFNAPGAATAQRLLADWARQKLARRGVVITGSPEAWAQRIYSVVAGLTPSDLYQVLDAAIDASPP